MFKKIVIPFLFACSVLANTPESGKIESLKGTATRTDLAGNQSKLAVGSTVFEGDLITTGMMSSIKLVLKDKSELNLGPNAKMQLDRIDDTGKQPGTFSLFNGALRSKIEKAFTKDPKLMVKSGSTVMGIRGTDFQIVANSNTGNTTLVTLEGQVAMMKSEKNTIQQMNKDQAQALAKVAEIAKQSLEKEAPKASAATIQNMDLAGKLVEAKIAPPLTGPQSNALKDTITAMSAQLKPLMSDKEIKAYYEVSRVIEFKSSLTPEQTAAIESVKSLAANSNDGQQMKVTFDQAKSLGMVEKLALDKLNGEDLAKSPGALETVKASEGKVGAAGKLTEKQVEALNKIETIKPTGQPLQVNAEQALALAQIKDMAPVVIDERKLTPAQIQSVRSMEKISEKTSENSAALTESLAKAIVKMHETAASAGRSGAALFALNTEQAVAMMQTEKSVQIVKPSLPSRAVAAVQQTKIIENQAPRTATLNLDQVKAVQLAETLSRQSIGSNAPVEVNALQAKAMIETQRTASSVVDKTALDPVQKFALAVNEKIVEKISGDVRTPSVSSVELKQGLSDATKSVAVNSGQFAGVSPAQPLPTVPVKVSPIQMDGLRNEAGLAGMKAGAQQTATTAEGANTNGISKISGKNLISPVPPGIEAKMVMSESDSKTRSSDAKNSPEGFYNAKNGQTTPPAGGYVDMNTGAYVPPAPGSPLDPVAGVYLPTPAVGTVNKATGEYIPPSGFVLDGTKGFVSKTEFDKNQALNGAGMQNGSKPIGFDPVAALSTISKTTSVGELMAQSGYTPPTGVSYASADLSKQSGASLFAGTNPANFTGTMSSAPPPPGTGLEANRIVAPVNNGAADKVYNKADVPLVDGKPMLGMKDPSKLPNGFTQLDGQFPAGPLPMIPPAVPPGNPNQCFFFAGRCNPNPQDPNQAPPAVPSVSNVSISIN